MRVFLMAAPDEYTDWLGELPANLSWTRSAAKADAAHVFAGDSETLRKILPQLRERMPPDGFVWVSWPKKASGVPTDITEDVVRQIALPLGFVDVKVCAVTDVWSGLKLVIRRSER